MLILFGTLSMPLVWILPLLWFVYTVDFVERQEESKICFVQKDVHVHVNMTSEREGICEYDSLLQNIFLTLP